jgi:hypothetical protein
MDTPVSTMPAAAGRGLAASSNDVNAASMAEDAALMHFPVVLVALSSLMRR